MVSTSALARAQAFITGLGRFPQVFSGPVLVKASELLWSFYNFVIIWFSDSVWDQCGGGDDRQDAETHHTTIVGWL